MNNLKKHIKDGIIDELRVEGNSMYPTIKNNQNIKILPKENELVPGKLYIFNYRSKIIIHRLLKKQNNNCIFIGDNTSNIHHIKNDEILGMAKIQENRYFVLSVMLLNSFFYNKRTDSFIMNRIRTKIIRLIYLFTHWGKI